MVRFEISGDSVIQRFCWGFAAVDGIQNIVGVDRRYSDISPSAAIIDPKAYVFEGAVGAKATIKSGRQLDFDGCGKEV